LWLPWIHQARALGNHKKGTQTSVSNSLFEKGFRERRKLRIKEGILCTLSQTPTLGEIGLWANQKQVHQRVLPVLSENCHFFDRGLNTFLVHLPSNSSDASIPPAPDKGKGFHFSILLKFQSQTSRFRDQTGREHENERLNLVMSPSEATDQKYCGSSGDGAHFRRSLKEQAKERMMRIEPG
jgi:hypothetical protein